MIFDSPEPLSAPEREQRGWQSHDARDELETFLVGAGFGIEERASVNRDRGIVWLVRRSGPDVRDR